MKCKIHNLVFFIIITILSCTISKLESQNTTDNSDSYILACGSNTSEAIDYNARKWIPDTTFLTSPNTSLSSTAQSQDPSLPSTIPYMTARIFVSESTYRFQITPASRHWIRLHFYPSVYQNFSPSRSFFSVTANGFTLLSNFSVSITANAFSLAYIIREFSIVTLNSTTIDLTFAPTDKDSFGFINGIEIISMPEIFKPVSMIGFTDQNLDAASYSMQTMFRLNVGGQYISPTRDSGLSRTWYDDSPYIFGAGLGLISRDDKNVTGRNYSNTSVIAPLDVYQTARSMGPYETVNRNYNLTWVFEVDVNFTYLVRLHFCEFFLDKVNQMVFSIFINNQTAEAEADVIGWAYGRGVPVYKDYAVYADGRTGDDQLWLALHPNMATKPQYSNAILNGLEIFKLNDVKKNLAGLNPQPSQMKSDQGRQKPSISKKSSNNNIIISVVFGLLAGLGLVAGFVAFHKHQKRRNKEGVSGYVSWLPIYGSSRTTSKTSGSSRNGISSLSGGHCRHFALAEIKLATDDFSESRVIGVGGFGKVYKGFINGNTAAVAIKRANPSSQQGLHEFHNEIELLSKLRHRHLVSLIGACEENDEMILVYDYMENGTLREHLCYTNANPCLSWRQRLNICIGAARGIHYLHTGAKHTIIHRDVKSTNILLSDKWIAKVSDFGLSKTGPMLNNQTHISTIVKGSFGYLDPEYFRRQQLTDKSDVFSFGVVLFEVLCGRPALNPSLAKEQVSLADWAVTNHRRGTLGEIVDPTVKEEISPECLKHFADIAVKCLADNGLERPSMGTVLWNLEYCLQVQNNPDGPKVMAEQRANNEYAKHATLICIKEEKDEICEESDS